jgi:hypothetical protein
MTFGTSQEHVENARDGIHSRTPINRVRHSSTPPGAQDSRYPLQGEMMGRRADLRAGVEVR